MSVRENLTLPIVGRIAGRGLLRSGPERDVARRMVDRLDIGVRDQEQPVGTLSGGNQQKVLLGRWLLTGAKVVLLYDVTRGVDVGTKRDIFELVAGLAADGVAVLFYSSETEEVANLSHRVLVMREGHIATELTGTGITAERIVGAALRDPAPAAAGAPAAGATELGAER